MGCQVMYIVECEEVNTNNVKDWTTEGSEKKSLPKSRAKAFYWYFKFKKLSNGGGNNR